VTQKSAKKKSKKATKSSAQPGVLGSLPSTRPEPIGGTRRASARATTAPADEAIAKVKPGKAKPANAKPKRSKPAAKAKPKAARVKPKAAKAKPKAAKAEPKAAKVKPVKRVVPGPEAPPKPQPARQGDGRPSGTEIVTTAVQAAGELAQIGVTVGGQLLRRAARRIPRP
jgi:hypothetical protein